LALPTKKLFLSLISRVYERMINKFAGILALFLVSFQLFSQTPETEPAAAPVETKTKPKNSRPDIPGTFNLELGFNFGNDEPELWETKFLGSRTFNVYYQYDVRIGKSNFFVVPGIGLSLERFNFSNNAIVVYPEDSRDSILLVGQSHLELTGVKKSVLVANYVEVPLEFKFLTNPDDPTRSFRASIGGRFGYLYDSFEKLKYRDEGEMNMLKIKHNYNLNRFRYGVSAKFGIGNFSFFGYYNLSPLFETDKGIWSKGTDRQPVNFHTITVGIALSSF
jgi:hypothetical protein